MPPKGTKRKAVGDSNGTAALLPPDRNNWPGWVELESEPEIFNIMLKDMDVRGLEIKEVVSLENMHTLP
jgi:ubiquitin carboxyl-terminal hydrolase L5